MNDYRDGRPEREFGADDRVWYDAVCNQCGESFRVPFEPEPDRKLLCKWCLKASRGGRRDRLQYGAHTGHGDRRRREAYEITCSHCGKRDTVPFKPYEDSAVLCRECMSNPNIERVAGKVYHTILCASCGKESRVPFKPDPGSRVLCHECHAAEREEKQRAMEHYAKHHPSVVNNTKVRIEVRCEKCGALDVLPFVPKTTGRILCRKCAEETFGDDWARRNRIGVRYEYPFTCSRCSAQDFVPFRPKPGQELLCRHCMNDEAILNHTRDEMERHDAGTCVRRAPKRVGPDGAAADGAAVSEYVAGEELAP